MEAGQDNTPKKVPPLPLQERALAYGMLRDNSSAVTDYEIEPGGTKTLRVPSLDADGFPSLVDKFRKNPKDCLAMGRKNLFSIMQDAKLSPTERLDRLNRYLDAYFELQLKLDHQAFPSSKKVFKSIPDYVPDGLSDMGSDPSVEPDFRTREKLRVDKKEIFKQSRDLFVAIFSHDFSSIPEHERSEKIKEIIAKQISLYVYKALPYDSKDETFPNMGKSISLSDYADKKLAACRQHALYAQVLLQAFGLTSRLVKTDLSVNNRRLGAHVNNLVRINNRWFVLDTTNPERINGQRSVVFMKPIKEADIDLNRNTYDWSFANGYETRSYTTRSNMYYRIRDNAKDTLG